MPQERPDIKDNDMITRGITGNLEGQRCSIMVKAKKRWFGQILTGLSGSIFRVPRSSQTLVFSKL
jgi:hypothetical protein